jgi:hypothetical protein
VMQKPPTRSRMTSDPIDVFSIYNIDASFILHAILDPYAANSLYSVDGECATATYGATGNKCDRSR